MKAIIDRIEEGVAVLLLQPHENETLYWPQKHLPAEAKEGSVLYITVEVHDEETQNRTEKAKNLINRLKKKN